MATLMFNDEKRSICLSIFCIEFWAKSSKFFWFPQTPLSDEKQKPKTSISNRS
jgi:hypothetical protein